MDDTIILTAGDPHISDINPRSRTDNFNETILEKLNQLKTHAIEYNADAVLLTGDLYNIKFPVKNSHDLNRELIELFKQFPCQVYTIPGNHDLTADDLETLPEQPISVLFASGYLKNLTHDIIIKNDYKISLVGIPYIKNLNLDILNIPPSNLYEAQICVMHVYAGPHSGNLFKEKIYGYDELSSLSPNIFVLGHYHKDQGIQWVNNKCFINLGSLSRGTLAEEDIKHEPKFGLIKITKNSEGKIQTVVESIPVKIKPASEVFDFKKRDAEVKEDLDIKNYVEHLISESSNQNLKQLSVEDHLKGMDIEKEVVDLVTDLIKEAGLKGRK